MWRMTWQALSVRHWTPARYTYEYSVTDDNLNKGSATRTIDVVTRTETFIPVPGLPTAIFATTTTAGVATTASGTLSHAQKISSDFAVGLMVGTSSYCSPRYRIPFNSIYEGYNVASNGPGRYCSPRHRMPYDSRNKGSKFVSGFDDVAGNMILSLAHERRGDPSCGAGSGQRVLLWRRACGHDGRGRAMVVKLS
jgi:hypothetical protein